MGNYLKVRTALVTGDSSGIGLAIAETFVRNGASVIITRRNRKKLDAACIRLRQIPEANMVYAAVFDNVGVSKKDKKFSDILNKIEPVWHCG